MFRVAHTEDYEPGSVGSAHRRNTRYQIRNAIPGKYAANEATTRQSKTQQVRAIGEHVSPLLWKIGRMNVSRSFCLQGALGPAWQAALVVEGRLR